MADALHRSNRIATIAELQLQIREQDIRMAQSTDAETQLAAATSALEEMQHEVEALKQQLQDAVDTSEARENTLQKKEHAVLQQQEQLLRQRRELEQMQASLAQKQASFKEETLQQQTVLDARKEALDKRERDIAAQERSQARNAGSRGNAPRLQRGEKPKRTGPTKGSAVSSGISTASHRADSHKRPSGILVPSHKAINLPEVSRTSTEQNGTQVQTRGKGAKEVSYTLTSATARAERPLPRAAPAPGTKPSRPITAVAGGRSVARSGNASAMRPADRAIALAVKSDTGAQTRPLSGDLPVSSTLQKPATTDAARKRPVANAAACGAVNILQRKILSAGEIQKTNKAATSQVLAEPARRWTTGQLRNTVASNNSKPQTTSVSAGMKATQATKVAAASVKPSVTSGIPLPSVRGFPRGARFPLSTLA